MLPLCGSMEKNIFRCSEAVVASWLGLGGVFAEIGPHGLTGGWHMAGVRGRGEVGGSQAVLQPKETRECASL